MVRAQQFCLFVLLANSDGFAAERPNIVHILIDNLGWQDVASYYRDCHKDQRFYETPHMDRLKDPFTDPRFLCWTTTDASTAWSIFPPVGVERATQENDKVLVGVYRDLGAGPSAGDRMRALRHFAVWRCAS